MVTGNYKLSNGIFIPKLALGTWQTPNENADFVTETALKIGYRHIDTALAYENECGIAKGIKKSGLKREEIFITSKIPAEVKTYDETKKMIENSLKNLDTDYIDLMLIHAPKPWSEMFKGIEKNYFEENLAVWKALEEGYKSGIFKSIGVSNFEIEDIENITNNSEIKPMVNQIRVHIGHVPDDVIEYCKSNNILVEAYSPNATGRLKNSPLICDMAKKYGVSVSQLGNKFDFQLGLLPLPKTTHEIYMIENANLNFNISDEDMKTLLAVDEIINNK